MLVLSVMQNFSSFKNHLHVRINKQKKMIRMCCPKCGGDKCQVGIYGPLLL